MAENLTDADIQAAFDKSYENRGQVVIAQAGKEPVIIGPYPVQVSILCQCGRVLKDGLCGKKTPSQCEKDQCHPIDGKCQDCHKVGGSLHYINEIDMWVCRTCKGRMYYEAGHR